MGQVAFLLHRPSSRVASVRHGETLGVDHGEFEDILAEDTPAIWHTNRPAKGGDAGAMLATIIERAAKLKAGQLEAQPARTKDTKATKDAKTKKPQKARSTQSKKVK